MAVPLTALLSLATLGCAPSTEPLVLSQVERIESVSKALLKKQHPDLLECAHTFVVNTGPQEQHAPGGMPPGKKGVLAWNAVFVEKAAGEAPSAPLPPMPAVPENGESRRWALAYACQSAKLRAASRSNNALVDAVVAREFSVARVNSAIAQRKALRAKP